MPSCLNCIEGKPGYANRQVVRVTSSAMSEFLLCDSTSPAWYSRSSYISVLSEQSQQ